MTNFISLPVRLSAAGTVSRRRRTAPSASGSGLASGDAPADAPGILTSPRQKRRDDLPGVKVDVNPVGMNLRARDDWTKEIQGKGEGSMGSRNLTEAAPSLRRGGSDSTVARTCPSAWPSGAAGPVAVAPAYGAPGGCVQVVDAYGRLITRCY